MSNTDNKLVRILVLIFPLIFNMLFFLRPVRKDSTAWICYVFIHLAYFMLVVAVFYMGGSRTKYQNRAVVVSRVAIYFLLELVLGTGIIIVNTLSLIHFPGMSTVALILQALLFAVFFAIALILLLANRHDEEIEMVKAQDRQFIQGCTETVRALLEKGPSIKANRAIERVYDKLRTSPVTSSLEAQEIESQIRSRIETLNRMTSEEDILEATSDIQELVETRNSILRMGH